MCVYCPAFLHGITIPLFRKSKILSLWPSSVVCVGPSRKPVLLQLGVQLLLQQIPATILVINRPNVIEKDIFLHLNIDFSSS